MQIEINTDTIETMYCVYSHIFEGETFYIGVCNLRNVFDSPDARRNFAWASIRRIHPTFTISIEYIGAEQNCMNFAMLLIAAKRPVCNENGKPTANSARGKAVTCNNTGKQYANARDAAQQHNISVSAMSNHLVRRKGYETIRGLTFTRIE